ncbi:MAG: thermonuclease family protein [Nitrososphaeraceae archaeon]
MDDFMLGLLKNLCTKRLAVFCFSTLLLSLTPTILHPFSVDARCPNGSHMSPSGDCEKVTHSGGLPRCPDGFHRSPDGDCERVSSGNSGNGRSSESGNDEGDGDDSERETDETNDSDDENVSNEETPILNSQTPVSGSTECKGSADCFRGIVTEIVDGDTLDVNNVRVRLAMVNTPESGEGGYDEAVDATESECPIGSKALVDEDDGQKEGSYSRLIGVVYCNGNTSSLNEILMETGKAVLYEDFCGVSEFANEYWVTRYGC